jgi:hypothetical protein
MEGNISPGENVPLTGTYKCVFCIMQECSSRIIPGMTAGLISRRGKENLGKVTTKFFRQSEKFSQCPFCGTATGWSYLEPKPGKTIEETIQKEISDFLEFYQRNKK